MRACLSLSRVGQPNAPQRSAGLELRSCQLSSFMLRVSPQPTSMFRFQQASFAIFRRFSARRLCIISFGHLCCQLCVPLSRLHFLSFDRTVIYLVAHFAVGPHSSSFCLFSPLFQALCAQLFFLASLSVGARVPREAPFV